MVLPLFYFESIPVLFWGPDRQAANEWTTKKYDEDNIWVLAELQKIHVLML